MGGLLRLCLVMSVVWRPRASASLACTPAANTTGSALSSSEGE